MRSLVLPTLILLLSLLSLFIGVIPLTWESLRALDEQTLHILWASRLPRTISLIISGMSLAIAGAIMQLLTSNRFVTPSTGSTTDWAKLGLLVALLIAPQASVVAKTLLTFAFAFIGTLTFLFLLQKIRIKETALVPLVGILYGNVINAFTTNLAYQADLIQSVNSWALGNFALILKGRYEILYLSIPALLIALLYANRFTILSMGRDVAQNLGIRYQATMQTGLIIVAILSSLVLVSVGSIPFVGLVIPNMVSLFRGDNLEKNTIAIALSGGLFLLVCDIISRLLIHPFEIPIGVTASILGCLIFIIFLFTRRIYAR
jgi:iron complex transport system permease protein